VSSLAFINVRLGDAASTVEMPDKWLKNKSFVSGKAGTLTYRVR
jgi:hypothetical protein